MKTNFTIEEFKNAAGCWKQRPHALMNLIEKLQTGGFISAVDVMKSQDVPLTDKRWWLFNSCDLLTSQKIELALLCAESVEPFFTEAYPENNAVKECNAAIRKFLESEIYVEELRKKINDAAYAAAYAAYAAATAADAAAYAAADAAAYAADAAAYAAAAADTADAADAAAYAAAAADAAAYTAADAAYAAAAAAADAAADAAYAAADADKICNIFINFIEANL